MDGLIDPFYESCEPALEPGHIWCDQPIYLPARHGLKITRVDPLDDSKLDYNVCGRTEEIFDHPPVASLKMESTEGAVVAKTKRDRPVIVIGGTHASELLGREDRTTHAEIAMVVPVYKSEQYSEAMRRRMQIYDIANVFYLPAASSLAFKEGFARLDHLQAVPQPSALQAPRAQAQRRRVGRTHRVADDSAHGPGAHQLNDRRLPKHGHAVQRVTRPR
jgi:hypothetical protein